MEVTRPSFPWINNYAIFANCLLFPRVSSSLDVERLAYQCRSRLPLSVEAASAAFSREAPPLAIKRRVSINIPVDDPQTVVNFKQPRFPRVSSHSSHSPAILEEYPPPPCVGGIVLFAQRSEISDSEASDS